MQRKYLLPAALFTLILALSHVRADWINLTGAETAPNIAEITVFDDRVEVALEVYVGDLATFEELVPDDWLKDSDRERPALEERLRQFSSAGLQFITDTGEKLQGELRLAEPRLRKDRFSPFAGMVNPVTRQRTPEAPADKRVLYAELVYPFTETAPKTLTMTPPLDAEGRPRVTIGFIVYHKSVPVIDFRYLGAPSTLTLDPDPWYSRFDNPNLKRHHKDALMSFLYVEPYEVRHEILTRVKDLAEWMDLGLRGRPLHRDRRARAPEAAHRGIPADQEPGDGGRQGPQAHPRPHQLRQGRAHRDSHPRGPGAPGARLRHRRRHHQLHHRRMPQQVSVDWELFTDQIQRVPATAIDPAGPLVATSSLETAFIPGPIS